MTVSEHWKLEVTRVPPEVTLQPSIKSDPGVGSTALIWVSIQGIS